MTQMSLFEGRRRKREGIAKVVSHEPSFSEIMRMAAIQISRERGSVSADDLRIFADRHGIRPSSPNAWGPIFAGKEWHRIGEKQSEVVTNNSRRIGVYRYIG